LLLVVSSAHAGDTSLEHATTGLSFPQQIGEFVRDDSDPAGPYGTFGVAYRRRDVFEFLVTLHPIADPSKSDPAALLAAMGALDRARGLETRGTESGWIDAICDGRQARFAYATFEGPTGREARFATNLRDHTLYIRTNRERWPGDSAASVLEAILSGLRFPCSTSSPGPPSPETPE